MQHKRNDKMHPILLPGPIGILLMPTFTMIALSSTIEPLRIANRYIEQKFVWTLLSIDGSPVDDVGGRSYEVAGSLELADQFATFLILSNQTVEAYSTDELLAQLRRLARSGVILGGIATGCHVLALAGLTEGYRVTAHWEVIPALRERFPDLDVSSHIFEFDRDRMTSAGGTAALDMILHAIEHDHGRDVAIRVSEHLLHERIRIHSDQQRIELPARYGVNHSKLVKIIDLMEQNLEQPLAFSDVCRQGKVSPRHAVRLFRNYLNVKPSEFYLTLRLERARHLVAETDMSITEVAIASGFGSHSHFSRVFRIEYGISPQAYRKRPRRPRILKADMPG